MKESTKTASPEIRSYSLRRTAGALAVIGAIGLLAGLGLTPAARAVDSDGDGVDNTIDCRPTDGTTWFTSTQARSLAVTGGAGTSFSWLAPTPAPGQTVYDVLRSNGPSSFASAVCLLSNTSSTSASNLDLTTPANVYFYLVRAKTSCGGALGENSSGVPTTGTSCSLGNGAGCAASAACTSGYCCGAACRDITNDVANCGGCGTVCPSQNATASCTSGNCGLTCNPGFKNCDGLGSNGCEINTGTNVSNCGNCGNVCPSANATPTCSAGSCGLVCNTGFLNCDGVGANGCETNTTNTVTACGNCSTVCAGLGQPNDNVTCQASSCTFSCQGENYDVDNSAANGCEQTDVPTGNHTLPAATGLGSHDCNDTTISYSGVILSDARAHASPAVVGFDSTSGSAPDYARITATGGPFCSNDVSFTLSTSGGTASLCYRLTIMTNVGNFTCTTTGNSSCPISQGSGSYADNSTVVFKVEKTCSSATREHVNYLVQGHL